MRKWTISRAGLAAMVAVCLFGHPNPAAAATTEKPEDQIHFNRNIRAILADHCLACHGRDEKHRRAGLRLDEAEGAYAVKDGKAAIVPGNPEASELLRRVSLPADHPDRMPHKDSGKPPLTQEQIQTLRTWIEQGAEYEGHWAFIPPTRPAVPKVADEQWVANPIDAYVMRKLVAKGLKPNPPADKRTLIRRVTLDLIGLPPTPQEVEDFVNDPSPDAYERVVDRLLRNPHYGEHMARFWLDSARYGDTHGLHLDNYREIYPYRDWIITAFNENKPYDQFTIEQLAGDLLENPTLEQKVATGFVRAHITTAEGGAIVEEWHVRNVIDRVETFGTVFMGLTTGCAACHDHKFDPISQKEFYQLFAYFNSLTGSPLDGNAAAHPPFVRVPSPEQEVRLAEIEAARQKVTEEIAAKVASYSYSDPGLAADAGAPTPVEAFWFDDTLPAGANAQGDWKFVSSPEPVLRGEKATRQQAGGLVQHFFDSAKETLTVSGEDTLFTYVYLDPKNPPKAIMLQWNTGAWSHRAYWGENVIGFGADNTPERRHMGPLPELGKWVRLEVKASHVGIDEKKKISGWAYTQFDGTVYWDGSGAVTSLSPQFRSMEAWAAYQRSLSARSLPKEVDAVLMADPAQVTDEGSSILRTYFVEHVCKDTREVFEPLHKQLESLKTEAANIQNSAPTTLVYEEMPEPKPAWVLVRGEYDKHGDEVKRQTPAFLPPMDSSLPQNRLGLAKWLVDPQHPLTARVTVNRLWQQVFGTGIVKTAEDFGTQGQWPSHPDLLDWLAVDFMESGWNVKRFMRMLVTSNAYKQAATVTPEKLQLDPANRLLSRAPRFRLDAETLRDQGLYISGLLHDKIGGPSVKPPQPGGLWEAVGYVGSNTDTFRKDEGHEKVHRRSMYTFWKRTSSPPQMAIFDAPSRESCIVRRERTNTPLQALMLMNDPQFVEMARYLGQRAIAEGGATPTERAAYIFKLSTARSPDAQELASLMMLYQQSLEDFKADPSSAEELVKIGEVPADTKRFDAVELASWTMVSNLILNLDEVLNK